MRTYGCPFTRKVVNNGNTAIATIVQETIVRCVELDQYRGERSIVCIVVAPDFEHISRAVVFAVAYQYRDSLLLLSYTRVCTYYFCSLYFLCHFGRFP